MMKDDAMKSAIARRRGKGIDLTISIQPSDDDKHTDLAPKGADAQKDQDLPPHPADGDQDQAMMHEMMGGMNDYDLGAMDDRKPRSLGERARMALHDKFKK